MQDYCYEDIESLNPIRPYDFETGREEDWYRIGLIDGTEAYGIYLTDKTPISIKILEFNGFAKEGTSYCTTVGDFRILAEKRKDDWYVNIRNGETYQTAWINTVGQFRAFTLMCGCGIEIRL